MAALLPGEGQEADLRVDLKGVIYDAAVVPCACSLAVVNITGTEAKVEALTSSFIQLTRQAGGAGADGSGEDNNHFLWDDDDNYQVSACCICLQGSLDMTNRKLYSKIMQLDRKRDCVLCAFGRDQLAAVCVFIQVSCCMQSR